MMFKVRGNILNASLVGAILAVALFFVWTPRNPHLPIDNVGGSHTQSSKNRDWESKIEVAGADFSISGAYSLIRGSACYPARSELYITEILSPELDKYQGFPFSLIGIRRIVLCTSLRAGLQKRSLVPDFSNSTLYVDVSVDLRDDYARHALHHEIFHFVDRYEGSLSTDDEWVKLNAAGFTYGRGGWDAQRDYSTWVLRTDLPGFVSEYSMSACEEDKAEMFATLMIDPARLGAIVREDAILSRKLSLLAQRMRNVSPEWADRCFSPLQEPAPETTSAHR